MSFFFGPIWVMTGKPRNPVQIRARTGALLNSAGDELPHIVAHPIRNWFGLAFRGKWMIALISLDARQEGYNVPEPARKMDHTP
jgi:hypothetical protein